MRIISGSDQGYVLEENDQGRIGVRLFDYKSGQTVETFYENDNWDVEELWLDRDGLPLAALYTDDRDQIEWFDEDMARLHQQLKDALGFEDVQIVSRSRNNERMLIWGGERGGPRRIVPLHAKFVACAAARKLSA